MIHRTVGRAESPSCVQSVACDDDAFFVGRAQVESQLRVQSVACNDDAFFVGRGREKSVACPGWCVH